MTLFESIQKAVCSTGFEPRPARRAYLLSMKSARLGGPEHTCNPGSCTVIAILAAIRLRTKPSYSLTRENLWSLALYQNGFCASFLGRQARLFQQEPKPRISSYIFKELIPPEPSEENLAALVLLEDGPNQRVVLFEELERARFISLRYRSVADHVGEDDC